MGVTTMKMIRSTRTTSTRGVTLMSDLTLPLPPPTDMPMSRPSLPCRRVLAHLQEEVDQLGSGVRHLDLEALHPGLEVVVGHDGRYRHEQPERRLDEHLGDTGRVGAQTARARLR